MPGKKKKYNARFPPARIKRSVEKLVDSESDCNDIIELDSDQWPHQVKKVCNGSQSGQPPQSTQSTQERLLLPQPETSQRLASYSSLFNIQRSASQDDCSPSSVGPAPLPQLLRLEPQSSPSTSGELSLGLLVQERCGLTETSN